MEEIITAPVIADGFEGLPDVFRRSGIPLRKLMIVGDTNTVPLFAREVGGLLRDVFREVHSYSFQAGEEHKNLSSIEELIGVLTALHYDRTDCIAALGGGVVGDMAGFTAAIYLRGIRFVQLPTSLLAQIDSSIGGKTGVDFRNYKNMIGAFHLPVFVYTSPSVLGTLPDDQFSSGMGEVIKSALLADAGFYGWLKENAFAVAARRKDVVLEMIRRTAAIKTGIVSRDPTEQGERALLNLGHTVGHAIEKAKNFEMLHGHCVALGLKAAAAISRRRGLIRPEEEKDIGDTCRAFGLPESVSLPDREEILRITKSDKKMSGGQIRFILLEKIGKAVVTDDVTDEELLYGIDAVREGGGR